MAKDFSFPFYINNWLGGTMGWTLLQKGAYLELLLFQFQNDNISVENLQQLLGPEHGKLWPFLEKKFKKNRDGAFYNEKMRLVIAERQAFTESRRNNRLGKTKITSEKQVLITSKTSEQRMEDEGEDNNTEYLNPKEYLKQKIEIDLQKLNMNSGLTVEAFELCLTQWSLKVIEKGWEYTGDETKDLKRLRAGFEKWLNSWCENIRKEIVKNKPNGKTKFEQTRDGINALREKFREDFIRVSNSDEQQSPD